MIGTERMKRTGVMGGEGRNGWGVEGRSGSIMKPVIGSTEAYDAHSPLPFPLTIIKLKTKIKSKKSKNVQKTQTHHPPRQRAPLRTHPHRKTRIFDIGTRDDGAVVGEEGGADAEIGVGTWMGGLS